MTTYMRQIGQRALTGAILGALALAALLWLPPISATPTIGIVAIYVACGAAIALAVGFAGDWASSINRARRMRGKD